MKELDLDKNLKFEAGGDILIDKVINIQSGASYYEHVESLCESISKKKDVINVQGDPNIIQTDTYINNIEKVHTIGK